MEKQRFCFLGDSITQGLEAKNGERYHDVVARYFNAQPVSFGISGAKSIDLLSQIQKMHADFGEKVDRIFILIGTNDYCDGAPIGQFFSEKQATVVSAYDENGNPTASKILKKRELVMDENTFCGRLNIVFSRLKELYPLVPTALITPPHRAYANFGGANVQYDELYSNSIGEYFEAYIAELRRCADIWSVPIIDVYRESGLFPLNADNARAYFSNEKTDRLHPNTAGHAVIAQSIIRYIKSL